MVFIPYIIEAAAKAREEGFDLWVFPGIEITCDDGVQCLALLSQTAPPEALERLQRLLTQVPQPDPLTSRGLQADKCGLELRTLIDKSKKYESLRKSPLCFLMPAMIVGTSRFYAGDTKLNSANCPSAASICECPYDTLNQGALDKIQGRATSWGNRRRGILTTGDNRHGDFSRLAKHPTWVRLGEPTAEALRQACLADRARITYTAPSIPSKRLISLSVFSTLCGDDYPFR